MSKKTKEIKCVHRHTIDSHPKCFAKGMVKWASEKQFVKETGQPWYLFPGNKMGFIDIESDGLKADFSTMLTWCIKDRNGGYTYDVVTKADLFNGIADRNIIQSLVDKMKEYKILVNYYGTGFDLAYIRTKALHYDIDFPSYGEIYNLDLFYIVRAKLCLSRKSLDNVCDYLGIVGKTSLDKNVWRLAKYGDPKALALVLEHNMGDTKITEELYNKMLSFRKTIRTSI
jgi:uncharacterized protein YprB with RNaseH-like and TPR domain